MARERQQLEALARLLVGEEPPAVGRVLGFEKSTRFAEAQIEKLLQASFDPATRQHKILLGRRKVVPFRTAARRGAFDALLKPLQHEASLTETRLELLRGELRPLSKFNRKLFEEMFPPIKGKLTSRKIVERIGRRVEETPGLIKQNVAKLGVIGQELARRKEFISRAAPLLRAGGALPALLLLLMLTGATRRGEAA
jgi:hypothetical protein